MMKGKSFRIIFFLTCLMTMLICTEISFAAENSGKTSDTRKYLGETVYAGESDGYSQKEALSKDDPHYGWKIGDFYINGFTRVSDDAENPTVLKNVGDKVKLSFKLLQNIDKLNGKDGVKISSDDDGYDESFGIKKTDFGRGMLIIQKTDYQGKKEEPVLHKNYLKGAKLNADTEVELCEEGDYEVALDYEISIDKSWYENLAIWNQYTYDYRIHFKFSVRNGNCMVYPFDARTKAELTNTSTTPNGFYLDFAKSRYLDVDIKKKILNESAIGLVEDTRFNKPASDGETFTDEGVYIITAKNKYTNQTTEKTIYVGNNELLKAYVTTGLQLDEIKKQMDNGATVNEDGVINYENSNASIPTSSNANEKQGINVNVDIGMYRAVINFVKQYPIPVAVAVVIIIIVFIVILHNIKKKINSTKERREEKKRRRVESVSGKEKKGENE